MNVRGLTIGFVLVVCPVGGTLALAAPARAGQDPAKAASKVSPASAPLAPFTVVSQRSYDTHAEDVKSATAVCPAGTIALGAGASITSGGGEIRLNNVHAAGQYAYARAAEAPGTSDLREWTIWAFAVCGRPPEGYGPETHRIGGTSETTAGPTHTFEAHCPAGTTLLYAGGWINDYEQGLAPFALTQVTPIDNGTGLRVTGIADASFTGTWNVSAQGACVDASVGLRAVEADVSAISTAGDRYARVACPLGLQVYSVGGTVHAGLTNDGALTDGGAFLSGLSPFMGTSIGWNYSGTYAESVNTNPPLIWGATATAICGPLR